MGGRVSIVSVKGKNVVAGSLLEADLVSITVTDTIFGAFFFKNLGTGKFCDFRGVISGIIVDDNNLVNIRGETTNKTWQNFGLVSTGDDKRNSPFINHGQHYIILL